MNSPLYNSALHQKVEVLLGQMNLDQKIGQMVQPERMACTPEDVKRYHLGSVLSGGGSCPGENRPADWVEMNDAYWVASMEADENHLAIPVLYGVDAIHGNGNVLGATIFPHNIGLGAANDPELMRRIAQITAREVLATGVEWTFAPTLAVAKNNHWGRTYESYSEDTGMVSSYAGPFVDGLQGDLGEDSIVACVKHFVGDGGTKNGIDQGETSCDEVQLRAIHMAPYLPALEQGALTVMVSFNSWNGNKCHGHKYLLTDVLKQELGFEGFVISDWDGIDYLSEDYFDAVGMGVNAGIDMFMVSEDWRQFIDHLKTHVATGKVSEARINDAVRRILLVKYTYGLFDKPRPAQRRWSNDSDFGSLGHREVAREAVRKSLVLLKNENETLPIDRSAKILVAGKNAHNRGHQCGGFTVAWQGESGNEVIEGGSSIWEGIQSTAPNAVLSNDGLGLEAASEEFDVAIVAIGELPYAEGMGDVRTGNDVIVEAGSQIKGLLKVLEPYSDSIELSRMHPEDLSVIRNITSRGVPVVAVLLSGRPLIVQQEMAEVASFVAAWLPGSEGQGIADVLFGDHDFQGRLSFTWPAQDGGTDAQFPLGFGLSYSY